MDSEDQWEEQHERRCKEAQELIAQFINVMVGEKKRGKKRVNDAARNMEFFACDYLSEYEGEGLVEGLESFGGFVGDWFIRKCMWSDEKSVKANIDAFLLFIEYLELSDQIVAERATNLRQWMDEEGELWCARALANSDPQLEWEDFRNDWGGWKDDFILRHARGETSVEGGSEDMLVLRVLLSARAAKFLGVKPGRSVRIGSGEEWASDHSHWSAWWRCEDAFRIEGTRDRVVLLTNQRTLFSFLVRVSPGGADELIQALHTRLLGAISDQGVAVPSRVHCSYLFLTGSARGLTGSMNQQLSALTHAVARNPAEAPEKLEGMLWNFVSLKLPEAHPDDAFRKMCAEDPPFVGGDSAGKVVPFPT